MSVQVPLTKGLHALVDECDAEKVLALKWRADVTRYEGLRYAVRTEIRDGQKYTLLLHRFIMEPPAEMVIDHVNRDGFDCRRSNMRICTVGQNNVNRRARPGLSGFRGVTKITEKSWQASLGVSRRRVYACGFPDPVSAAREYDRMALLHFGEFAVLNFPLDQAA